MFNQQDEQRRGPPPTSWLVGLSDEMHLQIVAFLDIRDLCLLRETCRTLHRVIMGSVPPFASVALETCFWRRKCRMAQYDHNANVTLYLPVDGSRIRGWGNSQYPRITGLRPTSLCIDFPDDILSRDLNPFPQVNVVHILHQMLPQAAPTVKELALSIRPGGCDSVMALRRAFASVQSQLVILELGLYGIPLSVAISTATACRNLVSLSLILTVETWELYAAAAAAQTTHQEEQHRQPGEEYSSASEVLMQQGFGLQLAALATLPNLRELYINHTKASIDLYGTSPFVSGTLLGCAAISQLRCLELALMDLSEEESRTAFCEVLRSLVHLEEFGSFMFAQPELWRDIRAMGGHAGLKRLEFYDGRCSRDSLQAMVDGLLVDFPGLTTLKLNLDDHTVLPPGETVEILAELRHHPHLQTIILSVSADPPEAHYLCQWIPRTLQEQTGGRIQIF